MLCMVLVIVVIFMEFGQTGAKRFDGRGRRRVNWGDNASHKYKVLCDTSFPYTIAVSPVLYLLRLGRPKVQFKVS